MMVHRDVPIVSVTQLVRIVVSWNPIVVKSAKLCPSIMWTQYVFVLCHGGLTQSVPIVSQNTIFIKEKRNLYKSCIAIY
jgi:hypothetical protein